jgi:uncharacterized protein YhbP (UPF0306 family)
LGTIKTKISACPASHLYLRLATAPPQNAPQVYTAGYVSEDCIVHFITDRKSRKAKNIFRNPAVAYAVDDNHKDVKTSQGLQMEGEYSFVSQEDEAVRPFALMAQKFSSMDNMAPDPDLAIFKIEQARRCFLDNTMAFGPRHMADFS